VAGADALVVGKTHGDGLLEKRSKVLYGVRLCSWRCRW
jgi:hypothetical protein